MPVLVGGPVWEGVRPLQVLHHPRKCRTDPGVQGVCGCFRTCTVAVQIAEEVEGRGLGWHIFVVRRGDAPAMCRSMVLTATFQMARWKRLRSVRAAATKS